MYAGNAFLPPVRALVEIIPYVSMPPGNSKEFQACADFHLRINKPPQGFLMLAYESCAINDAMRAMPALIFSCEVA